LYFGNAGSGGRARSEVANEGLKTRLGAFKMNLYALFRVQHPAIERVGTSQAINERAEAHALHDAANSNGAGACHVVIALDG
jgi:hypothetical protein